MTERTVQNLGEGFEAEVTNKKEYSISYSLNEDGKIEAKKTLTSETFITLNGKDGDQYYKTTTINYQTGDINFQYKRADKREDNTGRTP